MRRTILTYLMLLIITGLAHAAQPAVDTLLFTIPLNGDTTSIYGCQWNDKVRSTLAGPVLMSGKYLLFYSQNGYVLYNEKGKLLDSYSLMKKNRAAARKNQQPLRLAYPLDSTTLIVYRQTSDGSSPTELYLKKVFSKRLKRVNTETYTIYNQITSGQLFNLAANSITDEMNRRTFLMPLLVGYTSLEGGIRWWSIDRLYSFTSPLIVENNGFCNSFFPGLKSDQKCEVPSHQLEALGVYKFHERWFYYGIASAFGNTDDAYFQMLVVCDQAGNLLYSSKLIKQEIADAVLQHVEKTNTNFTVRKAVRHVFVPAINRQGDICYGVIDYQDRKISVFKRMFLRYQRTESKKISETVFEKANELAYNPILLDCAKGAVKGVYPDLTRLTDDGFKSVAEEEQVLKGYYITVHRVEDKTLKTKLARTQSGLPGNVRSAQDSIAKLISAWCPYSIALNHKERGRLNFFHYGFSDELLSARLLAVTEDKSVFIRVDCERWAEVVQFDSEGTFVNRFVFNAQGYSDRKDLVVIGKNGRIAEQDWESGKDDAEYYVWRLQSADKKHVRE